MAQRLLFPKADIKLILLKGSANDPKPTSDIRYRPNLRHWWPYLIFYDLPTITAPEPGLYY